jgi:hypothetical protein
MLSLPKQQNRSRKTLARLSRQGSLSAGNLKLSPNLARWDAGQLAGLSPLTHLRNLPPLLPLPGLPRLPVRKK